MNYNSGWANLKPQESKYTYALAVKAAKLLEAGETLSAVARELNVSRSPYATGAALTLPSIKPLRSLNRTNSRKPNTNCTFASTSR